MLFLKPKRYHYFVTYTGNNSVGFMEVVTNTKVVTYTDIVEVNNTMQNVRPGIFLTGFPQLLYVDRGYIVDNQGSTE